MEPPLGRAIKRGCGPAACRPAISTSVRVVTEDLAAYQRLQDERLSALPGVLRMTSTLVMKRVVAGRPLPA